jgi:hypothetical protein
MNTLALVRREERRISRELHLSHSRINRYLHCPEQYRLYYIENLRPRFESANLVFGQVIHRSLAHLFQTGGDPVQFFIEAWSETKDIQLVYGPRDSWEKLSDIGKGLLEDFIVHELPKLGDIEAAEQPFEIDVSSLDLPYVGIIDLVAPLDGERTVIDFKTSGSEYQHHEAILSDQLTAYLLADPDAARAALCVLVKTKKPEIQWHVTERSTEHFLDYLAKAEYVAREIGADRFYKRPGLWCKWCDYLPVCLGDREQMEEKLIRT